MNPPIPEPALVAELERLRPTADFGLLPRAHGLPLLHGRFRCAPEDFAVIEDLPLEPTGDGEHLLLQIRKTGRAGLRSGWPRPPVSPMPVSATAVSRTDRQLRSSGSACNCPAGRNRQVSTSKASRCCSGFAIA